MQGLAVGRPRRLEDEIGTALVEADPSEDGVAGPCGGGGQIPLEPTDRVAGLAENAFELDDASVRGILLGPQPRQLARRIPISEALRTRVALAGRDQSRHPLADLGPALLGGGGRAFGEFVQDDLEKVNVIPVLFRQHEDEIQAVGLKGALAGHGYGGGDGCRKARRAP